MQQRQERNDWLEQYFNQHPDASILDAVRDVEKSKAFKFSVDEIRNFRRDYRRRQDASKPLKNPVLPKEVALKLVEPPKPPPPVEPPKAVVIPAPVVVEPVRPLKGQQLFDAMKSRTEELVLSNPTQGYRVIQETLEKEFHGNSLPHQDILALLKMVREAGGLPHKGGRSKKISPPETLIKQAPVSIPLPVVQSMPSPKPSVVAVSTAVNLAFPSELTDQCVVVWIDEDEKSNEVKRWQQMHKSKLSDFVADLLDIIEPSSVKVYRLSGTGTEMKMKVKVEIE